MRSRVTCSRVSYITKHNLLCHVVRKLSDNELINHEHVNLTTIMEKPEIIIIMLLAKDCVLFPRYIMTEMIIMDDIQFLLYIRIESVPWHADG